MKKSKCVGSFALMLVNVIFAVLLSTDAFGVEASPRPVRLTQPDGTRITLQINGNEFSHWYEDREGYRVVGEPTRAGGIAYFYALPDARGDDERQASERMVGKDAPPPGLQKGLAPPRINARDADLLSEETLHDHGATTAMQTRTRSSQATTKVKNLVILMRFKDHKNSGRTLPDLADFDQIFNKVGGHLDHVRSGVKSGSVRDFYLESSHGKFELNSTIVDWVDMDKTESFYADGDSGGTARIKQAVREALDKVQVRWDATPGSPKFTDFDEDGNGFVDAIAFVHSGYGAEWGGADADGADFKDRIWSHRWSIPTWTSSDSVKVRDYHINPALWDTSGTESGHIGVICHETGHFFGLPDLYDTSSQGSGLGSWGVMANSWGFDGTQLHPPQFSAWSKIKLGWANAVPLSSPGSYKILQAETPATSADPPQIYRVDQGYPANEYLLIENRQPVGYDQKIPDGTGGRGGLAVWHIDENKSANNDPGFPGSAGFPGSHYMVGLLQADGEFELEQRINRGDGDDVFRKGFVEVIGPSTIPNTNAFSGSSTTATISAISESAQVMSFRFNSDDDDGGDPPDGTVKCCTKLASAEFGWDANNPNIVGGNVVLLEATIELPEEMDVHITASTAAKLTEAGNAEITTGFYNQNTSNFFLWPGSFRGVSFDSPNQYVSFSPTYAVRLPAGKQTIYWKLWHSGTKLEMDSGTLSLVATPVGMSPNGSVPQAAETLKRLGPESRKPKPADGATSANSATGGSGDETTSDNTASSDAADASDKIALLIGINDYKSQSIPKLKGCENDVRDMELLLRDKFHFPAANIKTLINSQATYAAIEQQFDEHLLANAGENTVAVVYFSGHGSRVDDDDPSEEPDGYDECLLAYDSRAGGVSELRDDTIHELIEKLIAKNTKVSFVFDSCHSGTASKATYATRGVPPANDASIPLSPRSAEYNADSGFDGDGYVMLAACRSNQYAFEYYDEESRQPRGTFTYFLARELRSATGSVSYLGLLERLQGPVSGARPQNPALMGQPNRVVFDTTPVQTSHPYVTVDPTSRDDMVTIKGGAVLGITKDSEFDVYPADAREFGEDVPVAAEIKVTEVGSYSATARLIEGESIKFGSRAVERKHVFANRTFPVFFDLAGELEGTVEAGDALRSVRNLLTTDEEYQNSFRIVDSAGQSDLQIVQNENKEIVVRRGSEQDGNATMIASPPISINSANIDTRVVDQIVHWARWLSVLRLQNPGAAAKLSFEIEGPQRESLTPNVLTFNDGDQIRLVVNNSCERPMYFGVIDLSDDGSITAVYPQNGMLDDPLAATEKLTTELTSAKPLTTDHLMLLAFDQPVSLQFLLSGSAPKTTDLKSVLPVALASFQARPARPIEPDTWHTTVRTIEVSGRP